MLLRDRRAGLMKNMKRWLVSSALGVGMIVGTAGFAAAQDRDHDRDHDRDRNWQQERANDQARERARAAEIQHERNEVRRDQNWQVRQNEAARIEADRVARERERERIEWERTHNNGYYNNGYYNNGYYGAYP